MPELTKIPEDIRAEIALVNRIDSVPTILEVVCRTTGMGFAAVARVTEERWVACSVLDTINFGLKPGGELKLETTICHEIRQSGQAVIIDNVGEDPAWCRHHTPLQYGFQSYISMPILLEDGTFFGTLCAIDPRPAQLRTPAVIGMFRLFAELIGKNLDNVRRLHSTEDALREERAVSALREQFIAVLGHDLRAPMASISSLVTLLQQSPSDEEARTIARLVKNSSARMIGLIDNLLDLARGRLNGGIDLQRDYNEPLEPLLRTVIEESRSTHPGRVLEVEIQMKSAVACDRSRMAQLFSNLLNNALTYGAPELPVRVRAVSTEEGFELSVANGGEPIPAAALKQLFQPFFRSSLHNREGLGLGLFIAHQIALSHGGTLIAESTPKETRFTFWMPV